MQDENPLRESVDHIIQDIHFNHPESMQSKIQKLFTTDKERPFKEDSPKMFSAPVREKRLSSDSSLGKFVPKSKVRLGSAVFRESDTLLDINSVQRVGKVRRDSILLMPLKEISPKKTSNQRSLVAIPQVDSATSSVINHQLQDPSKNDINNDEDKKVGLKLDKGYTEARLISDLINQKMEIEELLAYFTLFQHLAKSTNNRKNQKVCIGLEEKAISHLLDQLGYELEKTSIEKSSLASKVKQRAVLTTAISSVFTEFNLRVSSSYGYYANFIVKGINIFTNGRKRASMGLVDTQRGNSAFILIVKGDEEAMKDCLVLDQKEKSQIKQLSTLYRNAGFKQVIIGFKSLSQEEMRNYSISVEKISKSKRDQLQEYEKLAISLETGLRYVGSIGVVDHARQDAYPLISKLKESMVDISLFSGDSLDACLNIVKELGMADASFNDPTTYFSLTATSEKRVKAQIRRIVEDIHTIIKHINLDRHRMFLKGDMVESSPQRNNSIKSNSMNRQDSGGSSLGKHSDNLHDVFESISYKVKYKKALLISGRSIELIRLSKDKDLKSYLRVILIFSDRIIAHSMYSEHKIYLVDILQSIDKIVMAVGDGFNDIGMLSAANSGLQIYSKSVPVITADAVVTNLNGVSRIFFSLSHTLTKNILLGTICFIWAISAHYTFNSLEYYASYLTRSYFAADNQGGLMTIYYLDLFLFMSSNKPLTDPLVDRLPIVTNTVKILIYDMMKYTTIFIILGLLEAVFVQFLIVDYYIAGLSSIGKPLSLEEKIFFSNVVLYLNSKIKYLLMLSSFTVSSALYNMIGPLVYLFLELVHFSTNKGDLVIYPGVIYGLQTTLDWTCLFYGVLVPTFFSMIAVYILKYNLLDKHIKRALEEHSHKTKHSHAQDTQKMDLAPGLKRYLGHSITEELKLIQGNTAEDLIGQVKRVATESMLDGNLLKLIHIDSMTHRMGVTKYLNRIIDPGERNRFWQLYISTSKPLAQIILCISIALLLLEYTFSMIFVGGFNLQLHTSVLFTTVLATLPLTMACMKSKPKFFEVALNTFLAFSIIIAIVLSFANPSFLWKSGAHVLNRLAFGPLPFSYEIVVLLGGASDLLRIYE